MRQLDILEFYVRGNTVLDEVVIDDAVQPFLGLQKTSDDVEQARAALESVYRARGYKTVAVAIPRQTVKGGVVHLQVFEGKVEHLRVVGSKYHSIDQISDQAPSLAQGSVPNFNEVQKDIVGLNQQADQRVTPSLKAGAAPGTIDVDLVVDDSLPVHGSLELNNRRSQDTSELRTSATLSYDNLWQLGHSLTLSYQVAPQNTSDAGVFYGSYLARFGASPFSLLINGIRSSSDVATVGGTEVVGNGEVVGVRGVLSLPATDIFYDSITLGVDYKHFRNRTSLSASSFETPVTYFPFSIAYNAIQRFPSTVIQGDFSVNFASSQLGSDTLELDNNRYLARGQMLYFKSDLNWTQDLPHGFETFLRIAGQYTDQPLITNEQFSEGGVDSVRGYLEAEALGDIGFGGSAELRSPEFADAISFGKGNKPFQTLRLISFVDGARLKLRDPLPEQQSEFDLASVGAGLNLKLYTYFNGALVWAYPLYGGIATKAHSSRVLFRVWSSF